MSTPGTSLSVVLMICGIFALDAFLPLGVAIWLLYSLPILLSLWQQKPSTTIFFTVVCSALVLTGLIIGTEQLMSPVIALLNRIMAIGIIWITIFLGLRYKNAMKEVERLADDLTLQAAELESANRDLESFNYSVAHDLRKPLTVVTGYCDVIKEQCSENINAKCRVFLDEINNGVFKMAQTIDTLLEFALLARCPISRELTDLSEMARDVAANLRLSEPSRTVTFVIGDSITASADGRIMRAVLENLLGNAWKYTAQKPEAVIEFGVNDTTGQKTFFVRDNGIGFDQEHAGRLFDPFQRLHSGYEGFGIGLATVKRIIDRHGGDIWAEGRVGAGATFYFRI